jgi:hypothetical protein
MNIQDAAVVLHLRIELLPGMEAAFRDYVQEAFPVFEAAGGCRGAVYVRPGELRFDEVFHYATEADFEAGERAIHDDPAQVALLARWRAMLAGPPEVEVVRRWR